jgi:hypothetical protein
MARTRLAKNRKRLKIKSYRVSYRNNQKSGSENRYRKKWLAAKNNGVQIGDRNINGVIMWRGSNGDSNRNINSEKAASGLKWRISANGKRRK